MAGESGERNRATILRDLGVDEQERLLLWFAESYESGWRPQIYVQKQMGAMYAKVIAILIELRDFHRRQEVRRGEG